MKKSPKLWAFYKGVNMLVLASLVFYTSLIGVFFVPQDTQASPPETKYAVCHATGSASNPWELLSLPLAAVVTHVGGPDPFNPTIPVDAHGNPEYPHMHDVLLGFDTGQTEADCPTAPMCTEDSADYNDTLDKVDIGDTGF